MDSTVTAGLSPVVAGALQVRKNKLEDYKKYLQDLEGAFTLAVLFTCTH